MKLVLQHLCALPIPSCSTNVDVFVSYDPDWLLVWNTHLNFRTRLTMQSPMFSLWNTHDTCRHSIACLFIEWVGSCDSSNLGAKIVEPIMNVLCVDWLTFGENYLTATLKMRSYPKDIARCDASVDVHTEPLRDSPRERPKVNDDCLNFSIGFLNFQKS